jgi:pimeloyl-ACP methyl ester carboxylesterase
MRLTPLKHGTVLVIVLLALACQASAGAGAGNTANDPSLGSLEDISVEALRQRSYGTRYRILRSLGSALRPNDYTRHYFADQLTAPNSFMASYQSEGLRLFARLDLPASPPPEPGYPVVVFAPGWVSTADAPGWDFAYSTSSNYAERINAYTREGFAVLVPGYRGRGTLDGVAAEGIEFDHAWGNGSYLSPIFYTLDVLNAIEGLATLDSLEWGQWLTAGQPRPKFDLERVSLAAHSQGGDVALTALAALGDNPNFRQPLLAASIWAGNIPDRFTQADTFGPMGSSLQAFMSGDGSWTGSARGSDGSTNPEFVFPWPADWIGTTDPRSPEWSWQAEVWNIPTVKEAREKKYREMYSALNQYVANMAEVEFVSSTSPDGRSIIKHAPEVERIMPTIGGFNYPAYIRTPLLLQISDRDYYSMPAWNEDLAQRINDTGGSARVYIYPGTTHSLRVSEHGWFSPEGTHDGAALAIARELALFRGSNPDKLND